MSPLHPPLSQGERQHNDWPPSLSTPSPLPTQLTDTTSRRSGAKVTGLERFRPPGNDCSGKRTKRNAESQNASGSWPQKWIHVKHSMPLERRRSGYHPELARIHVKHMSPRGVESSELVAVRSSRDDAAKARCAHDRLSPKPSENPNHLPFEDTITSPSKLMAPNPRNDSRETFPTRRTGKGSRFANRPEAVGSLVG